MSQERRAAWDAEATRFDETPDHAVAEPDLRSAWRALLAEHLPPAAARVVDLGCGTGSLSILLAEAGHEVVGVDFSAAMLERAARKARAAGVGLGLVRADVTCLPVRPATFDVVVARHVAWALDDPSPALGRWCELLRPDGTLLLVEGRWSTGAGLRAPQLEALVRGHRRHVEVVVLDDPTLWGTVIRDERYLLVSRA